MASTKHLVESPEGLLKSEIWVDELGVPYYSLNYKGSVVIQPSKLGFTFKNREPLNKNLAITKITYTSHDETWEQPWGESRLVCDQHNQLMVVLKEKTASSRIMHWVVRLYDDGLAYRFEWPKQAHLVDFEIMDEQCEFNMGGDHDCWWIPALEPIRYEYLYEKSKLNELATIPSQAVHTPLTMQTADGLFIAIHEAALTDYSSMTLKHVGPNKLECHLVPWSDGVKVKASAPHKTPWRTIQVSDQITDIMDSHLALNLNEPSKIKDTSWIQPGKYAGIWWAIHIKKYTHWPSEPQGIRLGRGATTENTKRYINFASKYGFIGVLVEGWNQGWTEKWTKVADQFNFLQNTDEYDLDTLSEYALVRDTRLVMHHETGGAIDNYERQAEAAFALCQQHGIRACKTGYVVKNPGIKRFDELGNLIGLEYNHGQYMVNHYRRITELAARYQVNLIVHEPIKDTGIRRTWPNMMTREGARGQEFNAWDKQGGNPPNHTAILPFTRMLSGPMDFTPGIFDLLYPDYKPDNRVNTTLAKQLALYVVLYSPLHMVTDLPANYEGHPCFQFILDVPTDWEQSMALNGDIGEYVTIARQKRESDEWFLGSLTNEQARSLKVPLDFLNSDTLYLAEIYADGSKTDWQSDPMSYEIKKCLVTAKTVLSLKLAAGGGQAIRFKPITKDSVFQYEYYSNDG